MGGGGTGTGGASYYSSAGYGLRPVVCLNKTCKLEKTSIDEKEVFRIIP